MFNQNKELYYCSPPGVNEPTCADVKKNKEINKEEKIDKMSIEKKAENKSREMEKRCGRGTKSKR